MVYLSQRDPLWTGDRLGASSLTVGRFGCTTTCISMLSDYFSCFKTPKEIAHNAANYTKDGLVIWLALNFAHMGFVRRGYGEEASSIIAALKDPNSAVILQVNYGQHWVVGLRKALIGSDYLVLDPWTGKKVWAKSVYKNVTGAAYFKKI